MIGAIVIDDMVKNLIALNESQIKKFSVALNCKIVDVRPYGLAIGNL